MPVISICKIPGNFDGSLKYCNNSAMGNGLHVAIDCIKELNNASKFLDSIKFINPIVCKY